MIAETLASYTEPDEAARALIDAANDAGGHDNISVVIVDVGGKSAVRGAAVDPSGARRGRGWLALIGWLLLFALIVGGAVYSAYHVAGSRAYITSENGYVVVNRGVPGSFAGVTLSSRAIDTTIAVTDLDIALQARLKTGLTMTSLEQAQEVLESYRRSIAEKKLPPSVPSTLTPGAVPPVP